MKKIPVLLMIALILAACSPTAHANQPAKPADADQPSALPKPMAVTVRPPFIPVAPVQGNPSLTPSPFTMKDWQTFTSSNIGVAVDHPSDWSVTEQADGAIFASPQGVQILLASSQGNSNSNQQCTTLINSYDLSLNTCFDPASHVYSAEFKINSSGDPAQHAELSTKDDEALDVYKQMLNTLHLTQ